MRKACAAIRPVSLETRFGACVVRRIFNSGPQGSGMRAAGIRTVAAVGALLVSAAIFVVPIPTAVVDAADPIILVQKKSPPW